MEEEDRQDAPDDRRSEGTPEPDPNRDQRVGGTGRKLGKSTQQEDRK
jgi:hypothetical protein